MGKGSLPSGCAGDFIGLMIPRPNKPSWTSLLSITCAGLALCGASVASDQESSAPTYQNPVIAGDFADPSIILVGDTYYATGTSSEWAPYYPIYTSKDLVNWEQVGNVFDKMPEWTSGSFWAPEIYHHKDTFFVYYTARRKADNVSRTPMGSSTSPGKPTALRRIARFHSWPVR
ncbi:MAG: hypothetical protein EOP83_37500 [Verrucomicrobiaceae bacterium]|nr:MAG: hypothetical protein EOP83_37500 [Verrucomicrobiaceae bacterium]